MDRPLNGDCGLNEPPIRKSNGWSQHVPDCMALGAFRRCHRGTMMWGSDARSTLCQLRCVSASPGHPRGTVLQWPQSCPGSETCCAWVRCSGLYQEMSWQRLPHVTPGWERPEAVRAGDGDVNVSRSPSRPHQQGPRSRPSDIQAPTKYARSEHMG
ncbi:hypothetical protein AAFF_G00260630 [Aldrovandia affinis]|uniref:Uncharacterized protein n=1 Tax=Aldrovandia affinis TaxID=143900 RepID=A0AAD7RCJ0_9TELE|nr:hypothetical protein AAFF_G00260630 [Aldrovandia affinis]